MTTDDLFKCETLQHAVLVKRHTRSQCHEPFGKDCADFLEACARFDLAALWLHHGKTD